MIESLYVTAILRFFQERVGAAESLTRRTTLSEYIEDCHRDLFTNVSVQLIECFTTKETCTVLNRVAKDVRLDSYLGKNSLEPRPNIGSFG